MKLPVINIPKMLYQRPTYITDKHREDRLNWNERMRNHVGHVAAMNRLSGLQGHNLHWQGYIDATNLSMWTRRARNGEWTRQRSMRI